MLSGSLFHAVYLVYVSCGFISCWFIHLQFLACLFRFEYNSVKRSRAFFNLPHASNILDSLCPCRCSMVKQIGRQAPRQANNSLHHCLFDCFIHQHFLVLLVLTATMAVFTSCSCTITVVPLGVRPSHHLYSTSMLTLPSIPRRSWL